MPEELDEKLRADPEKNTQADQARQLLKGLFSQSAINEEQAKSEVVKSLFSKENIKMVTDIEPFEMAVLMSLVTVNSKVNSKLITDFIDNFEQYKLSFKRRSRREGIYIATPTPTADLKEGFFANLKNKVMGSSE